MQRTSGWLLCALLGSLMVYSSARYHCSKTMLLSLGLPIHHNLTLQRLVGQIDTLHMKYEKVEHMKNDCPGPNHLRDVCFPVKSPKCEDRISACVIFESLKVAENWTAAVGYNDLVCHMEFVRSHFKTGVIDSVRCESHQPNLNNINDMFKKKCIVLEIISKLKKWLCEFLRSNSDICQKTFFYK